MTTKTITENLGTAPTPSGGRMLIQIITPGTGSSGVYPQAVLEAAATAKVFPAGTHLYADHPTATENRDRPERSVKDLAGALTEDAYWDGTALVAEAKTYEPWSSVLAQMHDAIGVSIRASARVEETDGEGRPIIAELIEGLSVDFVTHAGRGGKVLQVLESARKTTTESLPGGLVVNDLEQRLDDVLGPESWVIDFTDEWVVYRTWEGDDRVLTQQTYTADEQGRITITGPRQRVARRVTYDATTDSPSSPAGVAQESHHHQQKGDPPMGHIQIDEAEHKRLTKAAEQVTALETERDAATQRATAAEEQARIALEAAESATIDRLIGAANVTFSKLEEAGLRASVTRGEDGRLDATAFEETVKEAATQKAAETGSGRPNGLGTTVNESTTDYSEDQLDGALGIKKGA